MGYSPWGRRKSDRTEQLTLGGFPGGLAPAGAGNISDAVSIPVSGRSPGGRHGNSLLYSSLGNRMGIRDRKAKIHGISRSPMQLKQLSMHW